MATRTNHQSGFGTGAIIIVVLTVVLASGIGYFVFKQYSHTKMSPSAPSQSMATISPPNERTATKHDGMTLYTNQKYGLSFYYPKGWSVEEVPTTGPVSQNSSLPIEYAMNVNAGTGKYSTAAVVEIVDKDYPSVSGYYGTVNDGNSKLNTVKSEAIDKGKQSAHYTTTVDGSASTKTEQYLYAVGEKTYSLRSVNEESNVQKDSAYWDNFNKLYESMQIK